MPKTQTVASNPCPVLQALAAAKVRKILMIRSIRK